MFSLLIGFSILTITICSSPEPDPKKAYLESFSKGLAEMERIAREYKYVEKNFEDEKHNSTVSASKEFDFIIIGAGPSGAALANRLTEVPEWKVLLLEAGFVETPISQTPSMSKYLQTTPYDWSYTTTEQKHSCLGMEDNKCPIKYGKALGGITAVDDMIYTRGNQKDYDKWADLGLQKWCWNDVLPYFKKIEDIHTPDFDRKHHAHGGPVNVEHFHHSTGIGNHILDAAHELGIKTVDYNGKDQLGVSLPQTTTRDGHRYSVAQSYIGQTVRRPNLELLLGAQAVQILVSPHTKEAYGVKFLQDGHLLVGKATKEIILAAGPVNTPQLLLLSGIGPKEDLGSLKIEPVADLNVGKTLKDQISFIGLNFYYNGSSEIPEKHEIVEEYLNYGKGPLTSPGIEAIGFFKTEASKESLECPDIQLSVTKDVFKNGSAPRLVAIIARTQAIIGQFCTLLL